MFCCKQHSTLLTASADGHSGQDRLTGLAGSCRGLGSGACPMPAEGGAGWVRRGKQSAGGAGPCPPQTNRETGHCSDARGRKCKPRFQTAGIRYVAAHLSQCPCFQTVHPKNERQSHRIKGFKGIQILQQPILTSGDPGTYEVLS